MMMRRMRMMMRRMRMMMRKKKRMMMMLVIKLESEILSFWLGCLSPYREKKVVTQMHFMISTNFNCISESIELQLLPDVHHTTTCVFIILTA